VVLLHSWRIDSVPSKVTKVIVQWNTPPNELTNIEPCPGAITFSVVVIGPVNVGNDPPVIAIVIVTEIGLLVFPALDASPLSVEIDED
jgi:hypothetical protein